MVRSQLKRHNLLHFEVFILETIGAMNYKYETIVVASLSSRHHAANLPAKLSTTFNIQLTMACIVHMSMNKTSNYIILNYLVSSLKSLRLRKKPNGPFWVLLGPLGLFLLTWPYRAQGLTGPYRALQGLTGPYRSLLGLTGCFIAFV